MNQYHNFVLQWSSCSDRDMDLVGMTMKMIFLKRNIKQKFELTLSPEKPIECIVGLSIKAALMENKLKNLHAYHILMRDSAPSKEAIGRIVPAEIEALERKTKFAFLRTLKAPNFLNEPINDRLLSACIIGSKTLLENIQDDGPTGVKLQATEMFQYLPEKNEISLVLNVSPK